MYANFSREDQEFLTAESINLPELGHLIKALEPGKCENNLFKILYYRYYNYDLDQPFMPQYTKNTEALKGFLRDILRG